MRIKRVWMQHHQPHSEDVVEIEGENGVYTLTGAQIEAVLVEDGQMCGECGDSGEVSVNEDDGEGHTMRGVGTRKCICQSDKDDHDPDRDS